MTEALAELWHRRIREEWGFADEDGPSLAGPVPPAVPRVALLVGLPGVPRPRRPGEGRRAARDRPHRRGAHRGVPPRARAVDLGDRRPPPRGQVLRRLTPVDNHASPGHTQRGPRTHGYPQGVTRGGTSFVPFTDFGTRRETSPSRGTPRPNASRGPPADLIRAGRDAYQVGQAQSGGPAGYRIRTGDRGPDLVAE